MYKIISFLFVSACVFVIIATLPLNEDDTLTQSGGQETKRSRSKAWEEWLKRKGEEEEKKKKHEKKHPPKSHKDKLKKLCEYYKKIHSVMEAADECWEKDTDRAKKHMPKKLQDKLNAGQNLTDSERSKFENEYGAYKNRSETVAIDIIYAINQAKDVKLKDGDVAELEEVDIDSLTPWGKGYKKEKGKGPKGGPKSGGPKDKEDKHEKHEKHEKHKKHEKHEKGEKDKKHEKHDKHGPKQKKSFKRDAKRDRVHLWLDRIVPYEIDAALSDSEIDIRGAMDAIEKVTCIRFVKKEPGKDNWLRFVREDGCWSYVGRTFAIKGSQKISLGSNCVYHGIIIHEILHALGFYHEQARSDRDKYVEIFWENIEKGFDSNFEKEEEKDIDLLGETYDYGSIMHYGKYTFAINSSSPTIQNYHNPAMKLGQRDALSPTDTIQLNKLYDCTNTGSGWSSWSTFGPCNEHCQKERSRFCMDLKDRQSCPNPHSTDLLYWGIDSQEIVCTKEECYAPIDGHWNKWGTWGECSATCDQGMQKRVRICDDPEPQYGGAQCQGPKEDTQACQRRGCHKGPYDCTFDVDVDPFCNWVDSKSTIVWRRNRGTTPSTGTGPDNDHTSGSGYYLYMEASSPSRENQVARLTGPDIQAGTKCLSFAYSMYGLGTGSLKVIVKDLKTLVESVAFERSGDQLQGWHTETFDISGDNSHQVIFDAVRGGSYKGDIAIDDIKVKDGSCTAPTTLPPAPSEPYARVGCYHDFGYIDGRRLFPFLINLRHKIIWQEMVRTFTEIVTECAQFSKDSGYEYFGIAFFGECFTGPNDEIDYARDGDTNDCHTGNIDGSGPYLVGKASTIMVYKVT